MEVEKTNARNTDPTAQCLCSQMLQVLRHMVTGVFGMLLPCAGLMGSLVQVEVCKSSLLSRKQCRNEQK